MASLTDRIIDFHGNLHPAVKWGAYLTIAGIIAFTAFDPAYKAAKAWKIDRNLIKAKEALAQGEISKARDLSLSVMRSSPKNLDAMRVFAHSLYALREPNSQEVACMFLGHPEATEADKKRAFEILAERSPMALVASAWNFLGLERQKNPEIRLTFIRRLIDQSHFAEAVKVITETPAELRTDAISLQEVRLFALSDKLEHHRKSQDLALAMIESNKPLVPEALEFLLPIPITNIFRITTDAAVPWLAVQSSPSVASQLAVQRFRYATFEEERDDIVAETIARYQDSSPTLLSKWLLGINRVEEALKIPAPADAAENADWFNARAAALRAAGKWAELSEALKNPPPDIPRLEICADRAIAAHALNQPSNFNMEWASAQSEASADSTRNGFLVLAKKAEEYGLKDEAIVAMSIAVRSGRGLLPMHERLLPLNRELSLKGRGRELLQIYTTLMQYESNNPLVITNYCYLGAIYGVVSPDYIITNLSKLKTELTTAIPIRAVMATAHLMNNDPAKAAEAMKADGFDWIDAAPRYRAVYGTTMYLTGNTEESSRILQDLKWDELLPRETNVFIGMISKARTQNKESSTLPWLPEATIREETDAKEALPAPSLPKQSLPANGE